MSTYSSLKFELILTGDQSGQWGNTTNSNIGTAINEAIAGSVDITFASADVTLTLLDTSATQSARNMRLDLTGTSGGARTLTLGSGCQINKPYIVNNGLADAVTVKNTSGTGISVPAGKTMWLFNNSTNVVDVVSHLSSLTLATALPVASGGTGVTTSTGTGSTVLSASPTFTGVPLAPTAAVGTDTTQIATTAFVRDIIPTGVITMWYGSIASIPSGWYLCDGANGTPNLQDKFIVGAGSTYAVAATGGSANAILVSHTHTTTSSSTFTGTALGTHTHTITDPGHTHTPGSISSNDINAGSSNGGSVQSPAAIPNAFTGISIVGISAGTPAGDVATTVTNSTEGVSGTGANLPPYYALAYIMKA